MLAKKRRSSDMEIQSEHNPYEIQSSDYDPSMCSADENDEDQPQDVALLEQGPRSLREIQDFSLLHLRRLCGEMPGEARDNQKFWQRYKIIVTGRWDGIGGARAALGYWQEAMCNVLGIEVPITYYSAVEKDRFCQTILASYPPQHIMQNVLEMGPTRFVQDLKNEQERLRDEFLTWSKTAPRGCVGARLRRQKKLETTRQLKQFVMDLVEVTADSMMADWPAAGNCMVCGKKCNFHPDMPVNDMRSGRTLWLDCLSPNCTAWTSQGTRLGWLHESTLCSLVLAASYRFRCPDVMFLEETPTFDYKFFMKVIGDSLEFRSTKSGPYNIGLPEGGPRLWLAGVRSGGFAFKREPFDETVMQKTVMREVAADMSLFLAHNQEHVDKWLADVNDSGARLQPHPRGKQYLPEHLMGGGSQQRLHEHKAKYAEARIRNPKLLSTFFASDISQHASHARFPGKLGPRPLQRSTLWVEPAVYFNQNTHPWLHPSVWAEGNRFMPHGRLMTPLETWSMQGSRWVTCLRLISLSMEEGSPHSC